MKKLIDIIRSRPEALKSPAQRAADAAAAEKKRQDEAAAVAAAAEKKRQEDAAAAAAAAAELKRQQDVAAAAKAASDAEAARLAEAEKFKSAGPVLVSAPPQTPAAPAATPTAAVPAAQAAPTLAQIDAQRMASGQINAYTPHTAPRARPGGSYVMPQQQLIKPWQVTGTPKQSMSLAQLDQARMQSGDLGAVPATDWRSIKRGSYSR